RARWTVSGSEDASGSKADDTARVSFTLLAIRSTWPGCSQQSYDRDGGHLLESTTVQCFGRTVGGTSTMRTLEWVGDSDGHVRLIDQTLLPTRLEHRDCRTVEGVWEAIRSLRERGAPPLGIAAAMGVVRGSDRFQAQARGGRRP